jgi:cytochrome c
MRRFVLTTVFAALVSVFSCGVRAQELPAAGDPQEGHRLALKICDACHIAAADQQSPPILRHPAPSFRVIADRRGTTAASLRTFLLTTHATIAEPANMPNPQLTDDQVTQLVSYILSLRSGLPSRKN